jgi:hypothetical protein
MKSYGNSTEDFLRNVVAKEQKDYILKDIAQNLAYIADELAESNRLNRELNGFEVRAEREPDPKPEPQDDNKKRFICGRPVDFAKLGGTVVTDDGDFFFACANCKKRFYSIVQVPVMPNEVFR